MKQYNPQKIEKKWQKEWPHYAEASRGKAKKKFYLLVEFPYPSGDGLHVGHCRSYTALDIVARKRRMQGFNVLFPMGWDAFGLPTENYAIKMKLQPAVVTKKNTDTFRKQLKSLGFSFDWNREVNTTDPAYYKWTQWIFLQLFKHGLAYKDKIAINWCPKDKIGLANEEVVAGKCERCGTAVEKREKEQWMIKITKYADRLIKDLDNVDYLERIKIQQKDWIGRSDGAELEFKILNFEFRIKVFTTRPDTLFGCTFLVLAPEHDLLEKVKDKITNWQEVENYIAKAKNKSDLERQDQKEKTGVEIKGIKAINPANKKEIPIFVADYVVINYGTGAIMAVPTHDERDFEFAKKYNLPIVQVDADGSQETKDKIIELVGGRKTVNYKLRDWVFSRQHYWGEPIPLVFCETCGWQAVAEKDLPVKLPSVEKYEPTDNGESPLASIEKWVNTKCPKCNGFAKRETDTMPNWAGSNWYFLAYTMPRKNKKYIWDMEEMAYWMGPLARHNVTALGGVDWYNGGMEHTTLHLLYSRFIFKFLWDIGAVPKQIGSEPYKKRTSHGMILGPGGVKMSKSKGNVINPDQVVKEFGADTLRIYEMFMGPFDQMIPWDTKGVIGTRRFLEKIFNLISNFEFRILKNKTGLKSDSELEVLINKTIKKVGEDIENMKFNTAVSSLMILVNAFSDKQNNLTKDNVKNLLLILSPFAPHLAEELWQVSGFKGMCAKQAWPEYDEKLFASEKTLLIVQINGKLRDKIFVSFGLNQKEVENLVLESEKIKPQLAGKEIKKIIFVPNKLINIVI